MESMLESLTDVPAEGLVAAKTVLREDGLFAAAEAALESGFDRCFVVDDAARLIGVVTSDAIRAAVRDGRYRRPLTAADVMEAPAAVLRLGGDWGGARGDLPVLDADGRIVGVRTDPTAAFLPVAGPVLGGGELRNVTDALLSTWISSTGDYIREFERRFAAWCGVKHGIAVSNGTVSLHLAMAALRIGPGDEVVVPDLTFAASANTVIHLGATPVFVDVDPDTWCMTPEAFERAISPRTKAVMPVHVFGRPAPMAEIAEIAARHGVAVIEDCAEAHGARVNGKRVGGFSTVSSFSFFANKIITTGEGGVCLTDDDALADRLRFLRDHGMRRQPMYWHEEPGFNYRMTNLQAAVGCAQMDRIDGILAEKQALMDRYARALGDIRGVTLPSPMAQHLEPVVWFCCAQVPEEKREALIAACKAESIDLRPFFNSLSVMPAYQPWKIDAPVSLKLSRTGVNLPTSPKVSDAVIDQIAGIFRRVLEN